jgi:exodeoxyribonuclease VII small subunit
VVAKKDDKFDFEKALKELEKLVENMEQGDMSLEDSMKQFERGVALTRSCQQALADAEQKVQVLLQNAGKDELVPFDDNGDNE